MFDLDQQIIILKNFTTIRNEIKLRNRETMTISKYNTDSKAKEHCVTFNRFFDGRTGGKSYIISGKDFDYLHKQGIRDLTNYRTLTRAAQ